MDPIVSRWVRRALVIGAPLAVGLLNLTHPMSPLADGQLDWWITLHLVQPVLLGGLALVIWLLAERLPTVLRMVSRAGVWAFLIAYAMFDTIAGVAPGMIVRIASVLDAHQRATAEQIVWLMDADPIVGGSALSVLASAATLAWLAAALPLALGAGAAGAPRIAGWLLGAGALLFAVGHPVPTGPLGMVLFAAGAALVELRRDAHAPVASVEISHQPAEAAVSGAV
jgi:hypothetical protein